MARHCTLLCGAILWCWCSRSIEVANPGSNHQFPRAVALKANLNMRSEGSRIRADNSVLRCSDHRKQMQLVYFGQRGKLRPAECGVRCRYNNLVPVHEISLAGRTMRPPFRRYWVIGIQQFCISTAAGSWSLETSSRRGRVCVAAMLEGSSSLRRQNLPSLCRVRR